MLKKSFSYLLIFIFLHLVPDMVQGKDFFVNSTLDKIDVNFMDDKCETDQVDECTLRAAIQQANQTAGKDTIFLEAETYKITIPTTVEDQTLDGDLDISDSVSIIGQGAGITIIDGNKKDRVFHILNQPEEVLVTDLSIKNGLLENNNPGGGPAILIKSGKLIIRRCEISFNTNDLPATIDGSGGAILNNSEGDLLIEHSTIHNNRALLSSGGGILNKTGASLAILNSTISNNFSRSSGGGIFIFGGKEVTINDSVICFNKSENTGGGIISGGQTKIKNTIITNNSNFFSEHTQDHGEGLISEGFNLIRVSNNTLTKQDTDLTGTVGDPFEPLLSDILRDNGGLTLTHALLPGSPAINRGNNENCPKTDQRGFGRPADGLCDIGAFEFNAIPIACGDGILQEDEGEACDDGNDNNEDACTNECTVNSNFSPEPGPEKNGAGGNGGCALVAGDLKQFKPLDLILTFLTVFWISLTLIKSRQQGLKHFKLNTVL